MKRTLFGLGALLTISGGAVGKARVDEVRSDAILVSEDIRVADGVKSGESERHATRADLKDPKISHDRLAPFVSIGDGEGAEDESSKAEDGSSKEDVGGGAGDDADVDDQALEVRSLTTGADKSGVTSNAISLPSGEGTVDGMGESFSAQLSTGTASFSVPIRLLPARGAAQPQLGLSYSSPAGHGVAGVGWSIGVPFIARQTDRGIPSYDDRSVWHAGQDRFVFNGGQELVPICDVSAERQCSGAIDGERMPEWSAGWMYFRARVEGSFLRFFLSPERKTWRVQSKDGVTMELGLPRDGSGYTGAIEANRDAPDEIYRWSLARKYDTYGTRGVHGELDPANVVYYRYIHEAGQAYLSDIYDTPPASDEGSATTDLSGYAHHTRVRYERRPDPTFSYRSGWRIDQTLRLVGIDIASKTYVGGSAKPRRLVRRYHFGYAPSYHASLLTSVQVEGRCASSEASAPAESGNDPALGGAPGTLASQSGAAVGDTTCGRLPAMTLSYSHVEGSGPRPPGYERFDTTVQKLNDSPKHSLDEGMTDFFDVNSDGLPDVLVTAPGLYGDGHAVFFNGARGREDRFGAVTAMYVPKHDVLKADAGALRLSNQNIVPLDLDGDGKGNLLHMPQAKTYAVYAPEQDELGQWFWQGRPIDTASGQDVKINFGKATVGTQITDVNFDGLVDVIVSTGTELQTFFALGRYPGGDGQFGHVEWEDGELVLSNEPVRHCLPWAGQPIRLDDPDTRLSDMNGDGVSDIVRMRAGQIIYWPGRGNGYFGVGERENCEAGTFTEDDYVTMTEAPHYSDPDGSGLRVDDVNGDGLSDLVQVRFTGVDIWLNVDGVSWADRQVLTGVPVSEGHGSRVRLVDVNGSGTRDVVWGNGNAYRYVDLQGGTRPHLLTRVDNGLGKTSILEYSTSAREMLAAENAGKPWASVAPMVTSIVKRHIEEDNLGTVAGLPKRRYVTEYTYRDPLYDGQQREFRGFRHAEAKRIGDENSPTSISASSFLLGECVDEDAADDVDACAVEERWRDNPREALKGLPVISETSDEAGRYLKTAHQAYRLRRLYQGLDGRDVRHAFNEGSTTFVYDTAPFASAGKGSSESINTVSLELDSGTVQPGIGPEDVLDVPLRSTQNTAKIQSSTEADRFGNQLVSVALGCTGGSACPTADERISSHSTPTLLSTPGQWLWRTTASSAQGEVSRGASHGKRNAILTHYNEHGQPVATQAELSGTLALDREESGAAPAQSNDGTIWVSRTHYDPNFGTLELTRGANGRCQRLTYLDDYNLFPSGEAVYPDGCGSLDGEARPDISSAFALAMGASYDHGLGAPTVVTNMQGRNTAIVHDEFGRTTKIYRSHPGPGFDTSTAVASPGAEPEQGDKPSVGYCALPSTVIEYLLPPDTGQPYSVVHAKTQDSISCGAADSGDTDATKAGYTHAYAYVDGFGRTLVTLAEADKSAGDEGAWIVSDVLEYDAKSAVRRKYIPFFWDGSNPLQYPIVTSPLELSDTAQYGRQRYDAFGRPVQTYDVDGTVTLTTRYHALSTDLWDAADLSPGKHQGSYASAAKDGHGRNVVSTERFRDGGALEERHIRFGYLPTGEVESIERRRGASSSGERVVRWMRFDSLGRMVLNVEPNTTVGFTVDLGADASTMRAWRYAYNDAGDLVGTSDARGCGVNFTYDGVGRLLTEDVFPCEPHHAAYSAEPDAVYLYDGRTTGVHQDLRVPPGLSLGASNQQGQLVGVWDRGAASFTDFDDRGRPYQSYRAVAKPTEFDVDGRAIERSLSGRYAPRWYTQEMRYDSADRPIWATTGVTHQELRARDVPVPGQGASGASSASAVTTSYTRRGKVKEVAGSYGPLVRQVTRTADELVRKIVYGDIAETATEYLYDERRRVRTVQTYRGPPKDGEWSTKGRIEPQPLYGDEFEPTTLQLMLQDLDYDYDVVNNPVEIRDWRAPGAWPDGAKPVTKKIQYDDLYRAERVDYQYAAGDDAWTSPFAAELSEAEADRDPRRAVPSPHIAFDRRVLRQEFEYDWLGNTRETTDDANGFYDRSLGTVTNGAVGGAAYQLTGAKSESPRAEAPASGGATDWLESQYDPAGNMTSLVVARGGVCLGGECSQLYHYQWDEVGRLVRARRWDGDAKRAAAFAEQMRAGARPDDHFGGPEVDLRYGYDSGDQRVLKTAVDQSDYESHTVYVFPSLELRRSTFGEIKEGLTDYELSALTEVGYLFANGVRLARLVFEPKLVPQLDGSEDEYGRGSKLHVFFELGDHLGSTNVVLDQTTSELVEQSTFLAYGATESDYRPDRWANFREDYKFTGKEEDVEVGLQYFGKRYLNPLLGRWVSADPLAVHVPGEADLNVYAYVSGQVLKNVDPTGLCSNDGAGGCSSVGAGEGGHEGAGNTPDPQPAYVGVCGANMSCDPGGEPVDAAHAGTVGAVAHTGGVLEQDGALRQEYSKKSSELERTLPQKERYQVRENVKAETRAKNTPLGRAVAEYADQNKERQARKQARVGQTATQRGASAHKTNSGYNKLGTASRVAGRGMLIVGAGMSAHRIVTAPEDQRVRVVAQETGAWAGAIAGGAGGAKVGAAIGTFFGPGIGTVIGAGVGGVIGGAVGGILGGFVGDKAYDAVAD